MRISALALISFLFVGMNIAHAQVAISSLPSASTPDGTEVLPVVQSATTKKATINQVIGVEAAASQTLTNKTISGSSNTLSNIGNASLSHSSLTIAGHSISLGGSQTIDFSDLTGQTTLAQLPTLAADSLYLNNTGSSAIPTTIAIPACAADGSHALTYASHTLACTSITGTGGGAVSSVFGRTGDVVATSGDYAFSDLSGSATLAQLPAIADNTILGNVSGGSHVPAALTINSGSNCGDSTHALKWTNDTGFGCQSITGSASAGGSDTQLQYNNSTALGGISGATTDGTAVTFASSDLKLSGSSSGTVTLNAPSSGGGTLTLPAGTDSIAGIAATQTLTNKTISGSSNTLSNIANASLTNSSMTIAGHSVSLGGTQAIAASDLSNGVSGTGAVCLASGCIASGSSNISVSGTTVSATYLINGQTGTSYAIQASDMGKLVTFSNSSSIAVSLSQAGGAGFTSGASFDVENLGAGTVTITPATSTINGASTLTIKTNLGCTITSDGTDYQVSACTALPGKFDLTNATSLPVSTGISGLGTGVASALATNVSGSGAICLASGSACSGGGGTTTIVSPQGRLTLVTGTPVMNSDQTAKGTIYYDCYIGNGVPYYTGSADAMDTVSSCEVSLTMATSSTGVTNSGGVFDIWWVHSGTNRICVATNGSGGGWASDTGGSNTARGTGYSQVHNTRGYWTNVNSITHCYNGTSDYGAVSADQATYLGSIYTTAAGKTGMAFAPAAAAGGTNNILGLYNAYNRVVLPAVNRDSTGGWSASSATPGFLDAGATGSGANNRISWVDGLAQSTANVSIQDVALEGGGYYQVGVAFDSNSVSHWAFSQTITIVPYTVNDNTPPLLGFHFAQATETLQGSGVAATVYGSAAGYQYEALTLNIAM